MSWRLSEDFDRISIGTAVAASANFPPVFPPLILLGIYDDLHVTRLGLSDGGVYDNIGITTLLDEGCTHIIASDTGAPFDVKQRVSSRYMGMIASLPGVLTDDVAEQQRTRLRERRHVSEKLADYNGAKQAVLGFKEEYRLQGLAFFTIDSQDPPERGGIRLCFDCDAVARLRTDLDSFGDMEVAALINAGYDRLDRYVHAYFTEPLYAAQNKAHWDSPATAPYPIPDHYANRIPRVLKVGRSRFFRSLHLLPWSWSWLSLMLTAALVSAATYLFGCGPVSVAALINQTPDWILRRLGKPVPFFPDLFVNRWAEQLVKARMPFGVMLFGAILLLWLVFKGWPWIVGKFRLTRTANKRKVVTTIKWVRAFAPAVLLLASLTPVWVAAAAFLIALVSYFAYNKPFLWVTRMQ